MMTGLGNRTMLGAVATAALVAFAVTAYGTQAISQTKPQQEVGLFEHASVGGRSGCEVQSWPYIAPECLSPEDGEAKPARRI